MTNRAPNRWIDAVLLATLTAIVCCVHWPLVVGRESLFYFDITSRYLPARHWGFEQIRSGSFPLWCSALGVGFPFVAEGETGILYPPNYLFYRTLPSWRACSLSYVCHLALAGWGAYFLFRRRSSGGGSLIGALAYALGGRLLVHQIHPPFVEVFAWFPWVAYFLLRHFDALDRRWLALAAAGTALQALAGSPPALAVCAVGYALLYLGEACWASRRAGWLLLSALAFGGLSLGLSAIQLLPTAELARLSVRASGVDRAWAEWGACPPWIWLTSFAPTLFGHIGHGNAWLDGPLAWTESTLYLGALALPLIALGAASEQRGWAFQLSLLFCAGMVLAAGPLNLLGERLHLAPVFRELRIPARFLGISGLAGAGLMALGWDALIQSPSRGGRWLAGVAIALSLLVLLVGWRCYHDVVLPGDNPAGERGAQIAASEFWSRLTGLWKSEAPWTVGCVGAGLVGSALARQHRRAALIVVATSLAIDLGHYARFAYPTIEPSYHRDFVERWKQLGAPFDRPRPRVLVNDSKGTEYQPLFHLTLAPIRERSLNLFGERGMMVGLSTLPCELPLRLARESSWWSMGNEGRDRGAEYGVSAIAPEGRLDQLLALNAPLVSESTRWREVEEGAPLDVIQKVTQQSPTADVLEALPRGSAPTIDSEQDSHRPTSPVAPRVVDSSNQSLTIEGAGPGGWLIVRETFYPGWRAWVNGRPERVVRANGVLMAVPLPTGAYKVDMRFTSSSFIWGAWITMGAVVLSLGGCLATVAKLPRPAVSLDGEKVSRSTLAVGSQIEEGDRASVARDPGLDSTERAGRERMSAWPVMAVWALTAASFAISFLLRREVWSSLWFDLPSVL